MKRQCRLHRWNRTPMASALLSSCIQQLSQLQNVTLQQAVVAWGVERQLDAELWADGFEEVSASPALNRRGSWKRCEFKNRASIHR